ncbi:MAG: hypothetical protein KGQ75_10695 [Sphingomonadales bacterium]|nr:hypothetical protein [Sphingomonadales bacterium]
MDFVDDHLTAGRVLWNLTVVDTFSQFSPAIDARFSYQRLGFVATFETPRPNVFLAARKYRGTWI